MNTVLVLINTNTLDASRLTRFFDYLEHRDQSCRLSFVFCPLQLNAEAENSLLVSSLTKLIAQRFRPECGIDFTYFNGESCLLSRLALLNYDDPTLAFGHHLVGSRDVCETSDDLTLSNLSGWSEIISHQATSIDVYIDDNLGYEACEIIGAVARTSKGSFIRNVAQIAHYLNIRSFAAQNKRSNIQKTAFI